MESTAIVGATGSGGAAARYVEGSVVAQKYRLVRLLGEGGMGAVWVAQNLALGVQVALKLIRAEIEGKVDGLSERLLTEARAAASIGHPAIIQVFDFGVTEHNEPYIAMELLKGESLSHVIKRRGRIAAGRAVRTLLPVIEGLCVANQRGIVHRDLKPDNIFLAQQANRVQPKLLDFGIAKLSQSFSANLTSEGTVLGSPAYMSPEQARGEADVDHRTDTWALCVVLYEMITGAQPFVGTNW
ncbi:MAG TPA: serine/threonine-protein kinase, partial [Polyangiaceae bacterium]|nr:serine/threonine-protein kinase [Polyangiaceae bacterium]